MNQKKTPNISAIILAAGQGTRMQSQKPKVLCEILFAPMLQYVVNACHGAKLFDLCVVTGYQANQVEDFVNEHYAKTPITTVNQAVQNGTGHAVMMAREFLKNRRGGDVCVLCGDAPCLTAQALVAAYKQHKSQGNAVTVVTAKLENPTGYGRIVRQAGKLAQIVEERDASVQERAIGEVNAGVYWFGVDELLSVLDQLTSDNTQGEYYLPQTIDLLRQKGLGVNANLTSDSDIVLGVNSRAQQLALNEQWRQKEILRHSTNGVEFICTDGVVIAPDAEIGADTIILPGTIIKQGVKIGKGCTIGPNTLIVNSTVGDRVTLNCTQCNASKIHNDVAIGPFAHIRPGSEIKSFVHIGDFVEVKNSLIGEGTGISHLTYIGDSDVGKNVNFGCGVVTVNYDGVRKDRCIIEDDAFIGCNTNLIAPVTVKAGAYTAAGSTITHDVPTKALAIARARQENKTAYAKKLLAGKKKKYNPIP